MKAIAKEKKPGLLSFLPKLNSQPCEQVFRYWRAMAPTGSTAINFNMRELCYMARRVNEISRLENEMSKEYQYTFNNKERKLLEHCNFEESDVSDTALQKIFSEAEQDAQKTAQELGIILHEYSFIYNWTGPTNQSQTINEDVCIEETEKDPFSEVIDDYHEENHDQNRKNEDDYITEEFQTDISLVEQFYGKNIPTVRVAKGKEINLFFYLKEL